MASLTSWDRSDAGHRKLVIIGDGACGKTSLLSVFTLGYFPTVRAYMLAYHVVLLTGCSDTSQRSSRTTSQTAA